MFEGKLAAPAIIRGRSGPAGPTDGPLGYRLSLLACAASRCRFRFRIDRRRPFNAGLSARETASAFTFHAPTIFLDSVWL